LAHCQSLRYKTKYTVVALLHIMTIYHGLFKKSLVVEE
jgi:hypothetical protein